MTTLVPTKAEELADHIDRHTSPKGPTRPTGFIDPTQVIPPLRSHSARLHLALTAASASAILSTPGRRRGTWFGSAATYATCGSRSQRCSKIKPAAFPSPLPPGPSAVLGKPHVRYCGVAHGVRLRRAAHLQVPAGDVPAQIRPDGTSGTRRTASSAARRTVRGSCRVAHRLGPGAD
jgi:hypothetical protein